MASAESLKPPKDGALSHLMRFRLDPNSTEKTLNPRVLVDVDRELPQIDARYETKPYKYVFIAMHDPETMPRLGEPSTPLPRPISRTVRMSTGQPGRTWHSVRSHSWQDLRMVSLMFWQCFFGARDPSLGFSNKADLKFNFSP